MLVGQLAQILNHPEGVGTFIRQAGGEDEAGEAVVIEIAGDAVRQHLRGDFRGHGARIGQDPGDAGNPLQGLGEGGFLSPVPCRGQQQHQLLVPEALLDAVRLLADGRIRAVHAGAAVDEGVFLLQHKGQGQQKQQHNGQGRAPAHHQPAKAGEAGGEAAVAGFVDPLHHHHR